MKDTQHNLESMFSYQCIADELSDPTMSILDLETGATGEWAEANGLPWPPTPDIDIVMHDLHRRFGFTSRVSAGGYNADRDF